MSPDLFGTYTPTGSWLHRIPAMAKLLVITAVIMACIIVRSLSGSCALVVLAVLALLVARTGWRRSFHIPVLFLFMIGLTAAYPLLTGEHVQALITVANLVGALYAARVLMLTTPLMELVETLTTLARPFDWVGIGAERIGLAALVMLRAIPYLAGSFERVGQAARARGLERHMLARITPVVIDAVHHAQRTGEALQARGLGEGPRGREQLG